MKTIKKFVIAGIMVLTLLAGTAAAFAAAQYSTPAEAVAGLTGRDVQSVSDERAQTGKTYGAIAHEAGVMAAFKAEMLEMKKDILAARVAAGQMTREEADAVRKKIVSHQATCDGSGAGCELHGAGTGCGAGFGRGCQGRAEKQDGRQPENRGQGPGTHHCRQAGCGQGSQGRGYGLRDGSCLNK
ncbi:MAG: hypothetical protein GX334_00695 [Firmicutes bacterium]|nr:hypothetical protein [Bacillota bacterium]